MCIQRKCIAKRRNVMYLPSLKKVLYALYLTVLFFNEEKFDDDDDGFSSHGGPLVRWYRGKS